MDILEPIIILCSFLIILYVILRTYRLNNIEVRDFIANHYESENFTINSISKLGLSDRIKYGVPIVNYFSLFGSVLFIFNSTTYYSRKVELIDENNNESTKFIELDLVNRNVVKYNEFDSYDI